MTSTLSPADTGEIRLPGEDTQNLFPYAAQLPPAFRRPDATVVLNLAGPQSPPPPLPAPPPSKYLDQAAAQPIAPLERVAGADETAVVDLLGKLGARPGSSLYARPAPKQKVYGGRHRRRAPWWAHQLVGAGTALVSVAAVVAALLAVR